MIAAATATTIDDEAAVLEGADADARSRAALRERRERGDRHREIEQRTERLADRQGELGVGAEPDVLGNRSSHFERAARRDVVLVDELLQKVARPSRARAVRLEPVRAPELDDGCELIERQADAAEAAAEATADVDEAEVKPRRRFHSHRQPLGLRVVGREGSWHSGSVPLMATGELVCHDLPHPQTAACAMLRG